MDIFCKEIVFVALLRVTAPAIYANNKTQVTGNSDLFIDTLILKETNTVGIVSCLDYRDEFEVSHNIYRLCK